MRDAELAKADITNMRTWENMLKGAIVQIRKTGNVQCNDSAGVARQLFALVNGDADELLPQPSRTAVEEATEKALKAASVLLGKQL